MNKLRTGATALIASAAISTVGAVGLTLGPQAHATNPSPTVTRAPCATQQAQATKAQIKLDVLTARFARTAAKVRKDQRKVALSHGAQKARAKKALRVAKHEKLRAAKAKKAQLQRVAHANARLDKCLAEHGLTTSTPTTSASAPTTSASAPTTSASAPTTSTSASTTAATP